MSAMALNLEVSLFRLEESRRLMLSDSERAEALAIPDSARRLRFERTRSALRKVLAGRLGARWEDLVFQRTPQGKPFLVGHSGWEFSLSHSGDWLAIAVGSAPLGIDLETRVPGVDVTRLAARFFSPADASLLNAQPPELRSAHFAKQWVAKEAALKAAGTGIAHHLHKAECAFDHGAIRAVRWNDARYEIREFVLRDGTPGAVACAQMPEVLWRNPECLSVC
jgi:4'-phosphopantetheinyl transferase